MDRNTTTSTVAAYASSLSVAGAAITVNEAVALGGLGLAAATFIVNVVYKHLHYRLAVAKATRPPVPVDGPEAD